MAVADIGAVKVMADISDLPAKLFVAGAIGFIFWREPVISIFERYLCVRYALTSLSERKLVDKHIGNQSLQILCVHPAALVR